MCYGADGLEELTPFDSVDATENETTALDSVLRGRFVSHR